MRTTYKFTGTPNWLNDSTIDLLTDFRIACGNLAERIGCLCDIYAYFDYNWFCASFETDRFGGIAAIVKYIEREGQWYLNEEKVASMDEALAGVPELYEDLLSKRDLHEVYERINEEY